MKIVQFNAENVKRLRAVEIRPDGNVVIVAGRNGQGKSSILDSIWYALGGGAATKDTSKPVRDGETDAHVTLDLGDIVVTREWHGDRTTLTVRAADGAKYSSPQSMLDQLVGRLSFDPLAFAQQPPREQLATLLGLVELPFDPATLDAERGVIFERRTDVGREVTQLKGQLAGLPEAVADLPDHEIGISDLLGRREVAVAQANENEAKRQRVIHFEQVHDEHARRVTQLKADLEAAEQTVANLSADLMHARIEAEKLTDPDVALIDDQLRRLDETNQNIRQRNERQSVAQALAAAEEQRESLTAEITSIDGRRTAALAAAKMPIDGLSFDSDGVTYQGMPFKQCSSAEQLRVSVAMAMAMNPKVRVIRIQDGSLLDTDNLALIEQMADANDFQVWVERVDESGTVGVVIEDGAVRAPAEA